MLEVCRLIAQAFERWFEVEAQMRVLGDIPACIVHTRVCESPCTVGTFFFSPFGLTLPWCMFIWLKIDGAIYLSCSGAAGVSLSNTNCTIKLLGELHLRSCTVCGVCIQFWSTLTTQSSKKRITQIVFIHYQHGLGKDVVLFSATPNGCTTSHLENRERRSFSVGIRWLGGRSLHTTSRIAQIFFGIG